MQTHIVVKLPILGQILLTLVSIFNTVIILDSDMFDNLSPQRNLSLSEEEEIVIRIYSNPVVDGEAIFIRIEHRISGV